jgi:hypothetical protein
LAMWNRPLAPDGSGVAFLRNSGEMDGDIFLGMESLDSGAYRCPLVRQAGTAGWRDRHPDPEAEKH